MTKKHNYLLRRKLEILDVLTGICMRIKFIIFFSVTIGESGDEKKNMNFKIFNIDFLSKTFTL